MRPHARRGGLTTHPSMLRSKFGINSTIQITSNSAQVTAGGHTVLGVAMNISSWQMCHTKLFLWEHFRTRVQSTKHQPFSNSIQTPPL